MCVYTVYTVSLFSIRVRLFGGLCGRLTHPDTLTRSSTPRLNSLVWCACIVKLSHKMPLIAMRNAHHTINATAHRAFLSHTHSFTFFYDCRYISAFCTPRRPVPYTSVYVYRICICARPYRLILGLSQVCYATHTAVEQYIIVRRLCGVVNVLTLCSLTLFTLYRNTVARHVLYREVCVRHIRGNSLEWI
jgi:hypothetical protein